MQLVYSEFELSSVWNGTYTTTAAGPLLDAVQMSALYPDSKTFVDKKLKHSPGKIIKRFEELVKANDGKSLTKEQIKEVS